MLLHICMIVSGRVHQLLDQQNESNPTLFLFHVKKRTTTGREKKSRPNSKNSQEGPNSQRVFSPPLCFRWGSHFPTFAPFPAPCEAASAKLHAVLSNVTRNQLSRNEGKNFGRPGSGGPWALRFGEFGGPVWDNSQKRNMGIFSGV